MNIIVNARPKTIIEGELSYNEIVSLSGLQTRTLLTIVYKGQSRSGSVVPGGSVKPEEGMIFSVADTSNG